MNNTELALLLADLDNTVEDNILEVKQKLIDLFRTESTDNSRAVTESAFHNCMADYLINSRFNSQFNKKYDRNKKDLDVCASLLDYSIDGVPSTTVEIGRSNTFRYAKKQNVSGTTVAVTDLVTELARLGVEKSIVDKAVANAEKVKKGNTYYIVELV